MQRHPRSNFFRRFKERTFYGLFVFASRWLKKNSRDGWKRAVSSISEGGTSVATPLLSTQPQPFKTKSLESLTGKGSSVDSPQLAPRASILPDWSREIQPFLQNQLSEHTRRAYETDLKQFLRFIEGKIDPRNLRALQPEHIILFRKSLEEGRLTGRPMANSSVNRKLAVVKSFLNWLRLNRVLPDNPAQLVKGFPQTQESSLKGLSDEEVKKMLELPRTTTKAGALHGAVLTVLLHLGLRKGELIALRMGDLDEERGVKVIRVRGKGHRIRILPITPLVKAQIDNYLWVCRRDRNDKEAPLFSPTKNPKNGILMKHLNPNALTYIVQRYARKAGILKPISPHSCRATCISHALDKRATHRSVQSLAGWSTPLMIQRYDKRREDLNNSAALLIDYGTLPPATSASV